MGVPVACATVLAIALTVMGDPAPLAAQDHRHPGEITPVAKKMNEVFGADAAGAANGLESPGRALFDKRFEVVALLELKPGMDVADIGAGSGLFTRLIAERVAPTGTVYGVEIAKGLVDHIAKTATQNGLRNVKAVLGEADSPKLAPGSVDLVFVADSYHHFEHPREMLDGIKQALRPGGIFWLIDWERIEGVSHPFILDMVRAGKSTFVEEIRTAGFNLVKEVHLFDDEYVLKFVSR
jgi:predicted methyltransferase